MANGRFETIPPTTTLEDLEKHNRNWQRADRDLSSLQSQITNEQQARIAADQAHQNSTTAHPAEHITYSGKVSGATNVKQAADRLNDRIDNIVAQGGSDNTEVVDARMGADGVARPTLGTLVREIHAQQIDSARQTVTLKHGQNIVTTDQASPAEIIVRGRTMVNLLGSDGNFEVDSDGNGIANGWSLIGNATPAIETSIVRYGTKSQKLVVIGGYPHLMKKIVFESGKYYVIIVDCYCSAANEALLVTNPGGGSGSNTSTLANQWQTLYYKFVGDGSAREIRLFASASGTSGVTTIFDGVSVYEVDAETYTAIGTTITRTNIRDYFPHIDGIQHVTNPVITKYGKNLVPNGNGPSSIGWSSYYRGFNGWNTEKNAFEIKGVSGGNGNYGMVTDYIIPTIAGQTYTVSFKLEQLQLSGGNMAYAALAYADGTQLRANLPAKQNGYMQLQITATRTELARLELVGFHSANLNYEVYISEIQLELGDVATPFEPRNDDHVYAECTLRGLPNGVKDQLSLSDKQITRFVSREVVLTGDLDWYYSSEIGDYYQIGLPNYLTDIVKQPSIPDWAIVLSDDGNYSAVTTFAASRSVNTNASGVLLVRIEKSKINSQSGSSTLEKAKAYLNQYPITIVYQLATPVTETVFVEGSVALHDGKNLIDVSEGVILREKFDPLYHPGDRAYYVNVPEYIEGTELNHRVDKILAIYRNNILDTKWVIVTGPVAHGRQYAFIYDKDFDPEAEYSVTYLVLDKYALTANVTDVTAQYNTNQKMVVDALTRDMADAKTEISIHDRILAEYAARLLALEEG